MKQKRDRAYKASFLITKSKKNKNKKSRAKNHAAFLYLFGKDQVSIIKVDCLL
jgi:hypothetical protein